jgi:hypothetical protein
MIPEDSNPSEVPESELLARSDTTRVLMSEFERRLEAARAQRHEVLSRRDRRTRKASDEAPPPGDSPLDRAVAALAAPRRGQAALTGRKWLSALKERRPGPALAYCGTFLIGLAIGIHIVAGPRAGGGAEAQARATSLPPSIAALAVTEIKAPTAPRVLAQSDARLPDPGAHPALSDRPKTLATVLASDALPGQTIAAPALRVFVNAPSGLASDRVEHVAGLLAPEDTDTRVARVHFTVSQSHVRYYHAEDADAAARIAEITGSVLRDFTAFTPQPQTGTLELYLAGEPSVPVVTRRFDMSRDPIARFGAALNQLVRIGG